MKENFLNKKEKQKDTKNTMCFSYIIFHLFNITQEPYFPFVSYFYADLRTKKNKIQNNEKKKFKDQTEQKANNNDNLEERKEIKIVLLELFFSRRCRSKAR